MSNNPIYIIVTESVLDVILTNRLIDDSGIPLATPDNGIKSRWLDDHTLAFASGVERATEFFAFINFSELKKLSGPKDLPYGRIARVLKAARNPPIHLPRSWAEFHHANLLGFFAESQAQDSKRWVAEVEGGERCIRFVRLTDSKNTVDLVNYEQSKISSQGDALYEFVQELREAESNKRESKESFVKEFDLSAIGGSAVSAGQTYDDWLPKLSEHQRRAATLPSSDSVRIVGPAGTGKTLTICMRAIHISRDESVIGARKKILVVAHSWAMAERIDQILTTLNYGQIPDSITVLPLLSVIQLHANSSMGSHYEVLGDDSQEGSRRVMEILERVLVEEDVVGSLKVSEWVRSAYLSNAGSSKHGELIFDLYEEITGVIAAQNIFPGDNDKIAEYYSMEREDYLPPFDSKQDRIFCMRVFEALLSRLIDRGLITTDQLILDAVRVFETFAWNVRRQTEGYDYILVDELQLFGPQERLAVSLLARTRSGFAWAAAEDPSQGVFSSLYGREGKSAPLDSIYLNDVHRFNIGLFAFVQFIYGKFPLNVPALNIAPGKSGSSAPVVNTQVSTSNISDEVCGRVVDIVSRLKGGERIAVVLIGDLAEGVTEKLASAQMNPIQLRSFDDIERLSYQKKAIVVSPWQFVGGTQFSHVLLVISETASPRNSFARLRELTAIYLGASRASEYLEVLCCYRIPQIIQDALDAGVIESTAV